MSDVQSNIRTYRRDTSVVFMRSNDTYGGLSNMCAGYPLKVNGVYIRTVEALYQACKHPHDPRIQKEIISQSSPMLAAKIGRSYALRDDWYDINIDVMRWCLQVKLLQNYDTFGTLLNSTEDFPIVECSYRDTFWGAKPVDEMTLVGTNALGRLLMELRTKLLPRAYWIMPPEIPNFRLYGEHITVVDFA